MKFQTTTSLAPTGISRRRLLKTAAAAGVSLAAPSLLRAQEAPVIRIGYWPISAGLPFYAAIELGYFTEAGVTVEVQRYAGAQQIMEAMLSGRCDGSANGTGSGNLAIGELANPGLLKIFATNPTNKEYVLDEVIIGADAAYATIADLSGKTVAGGQGIQNMTLAREVFTRGGATDFNLVEVPLDQQIAAIASGQIEAAYTLEPQGTIGRLNGITKVLESGVIATYILGDGMAPWHGGSASLTSTFIDAHPDLATAYVEAYRRGIEYVRANPDEARQYLTGYTAIEGALASEVPISGYMMYDEFDDTAMQYFQDFFDLFSDQGIFATPLDVTTMMYGA